MIIYWDKKTNSKNRIGQRVKELRKAHNLTQKTLAAKLQLAGYDFNDLAILRIEQGTRFVPDYEVVVCAPSSRQLKKYRFFATQIMLGSIFMLP